MQNQLGHLLEVQWGAKNENPNFKGVSVQERVRELTLVEVAYPSIE